MSGRSNLRSILEPHLSVERCTAEFVDLVRIPSPQTAMMEAEPALRRFIETAVEPRLRALGFDDCRYDQMGNLIAGMGPSGSRSLMLVSHAMNQPPTTMPNPYTGEIVDGAPFGLVGKVVRGRGASEQKGTMAAMLHAMEAVRHAGIPLGGRLTFVCCVSGETGREDAIRNVVEVEGVRADIAILYGNLLRLQLGNRGRIDMRVIVHGETCHSSRPKDGCNAVTGAIEIVCRTQEQNPSRQSTPAAWFRKPHGKRFLELSGFHSHGAGSLRHFTRPSPLAGGRPGRGGRSDHGRGDVGRRSA